MHYQLNESIANIHIIGVILAVVFIQILIEYVIEYKQKVKTLKVCCIIQKKGH